MVNFLLRDIDPKVWQRVKVRAVTEGHTFRHVILLLLRMYADGLRLKKGGAQ